ncbi:MAG: hypothetical protein WKG01_19265 [Kofleriaceae bacterium]
MRTPLAIALLYTACSWHPDLDARFACPDDRCPSGYTCLEGRCEPILPDAGPAPAWWNTAWATRSRLRIHNRSEQRARAGLPVMIELEFSDVGVPDIDELVIVYHDGNTWTRLPFYWVYQERFADVFWFRLPADIPPLSAEDGVWIYAGNPAAPGAGTEGISVWEQHDYFDTIGASWAASGDVTSVNNNSVRIGPGGVFRGQATWPVDYAVDAAIVAPAWTQGVSIGFQRSGDFVDAEPLARWAHNGTGFVPELEVGAVDEPRWSGEAVIVADNRVEVGVDRFADRIRYWLRSKVEAERAFGGGDDFLEPMQIRLANTGTTAFELAQIRVRRTMNPLPQVTRGALEPRP